MKIIQAIYNFLVGDIIILTGTILVFLLLGLLSLVPALATIRGFSGAILILAVLIILGITLRRELGR